MKHLFTLKNITAALALLMGLLESFDKASNALPPGAVASTTTTTATPTVQ